jgi:pimeloyl-ACP methyl ester carboxylesterase
VLSAMQSHLICAFVVTALALGNHPSNARAQISPPDGEAIHVRGESLLLAGRVFKSAHVSKHPHLIVVLHGDAPFREPTYQYEFARRAASMLDDAVVAAFLRPGYSDGHGLKSEGKIGWKNGDNYTRDRVDAIAAAARARFSQYQAADLTFVGHSGGAAIAADLLGLFPHLASRALLVSCPCDLPAFRRGMMELQWNPVWLMPVDSISPQDHVGTISDEAEVRMVVGAEDQLTPPVLTMNFAKALKARGIDVSVIELPGLGHEVFLDPQVLAQLRPLMKASMRIRHPLPIAK